MFTEQNYEHVYFFSAGLDIQLQGEDTNSVKNTTAALLLASEEVGMEVNV
jgi:hypothetical protein